MRVKTLNQREVFYETNNYNHHIWISTGIDSATPCSKDRSKKHIQMGKMKIKTDLKKSRIPKSFFWTPPRESLSGLAEVGGKHRDGLIRTRFNHREQMTFCLSGCNYVAFICRPNNNILNEANYCRCSSQTHRRRYLLTARKASRELISIHRVAIYYFV